MAVSFSFLFLFFFFFFFRATKRRANFDDEAMDGSRCARKKGRGKGTRTRMWLYAGVERALEIRHTFHFLKRLRFPSWLQILEISRLVQFQPRDHRFQPILLTSLKNVDQKRSIRFVSIQYKNISDLNKRVYISVILILTQ